MDPLVHAFWLPKQGNEEDEYEDAYAYSLEDKHFAIADGATESSFADRWARSLVAEYIKSPPTISRLTEWLKPLQQQWHGSIPWGELPWFAEEKAVTGAFATFLGLSFVKQRSSSKTLFFRKSDPEELRWKATGVGDSCLFQIRHEELISSFPLTQSEQFNSRPVLLCSNPRNNGPVWDQVVKGEGSCLPGDQFMLVTDALAKWFLTEHENGRKPWEVLGSIKNPEAFQKFVNEQRSSGAMRNDDMTLLICNWTSRPRAGRTMLFKKTEIKD